MFEIGWLELLVIVVVAIVVVGPKDLPRLMRTFGHYASKVRRMANDFQRQFDQAMTDAELEEMQRRYREAVEIPEQVKGPPMLPVPEEAREHPQNQAKTAHSETPEAADAPAKPTPKPRSRKTASRTASKTGGTPKTKASGTRKSASRSKSAARAKSASASSAAPKTATASGPSKSRASKSRGTKSTASKPVSAGNPDDTTETSS